MNPVRFEDEYPEEAAFLAYLYSEGPLFRPDPRFKGHKGFLPSPWGPWGVPYEAVAVKAVGRNEPCPCGSGKKYKKCCIK